MKIRRASFTNTKRFGKVFRVRNRGSESWYSYDGVVWWKMVKQANGQYEKVTVPTNDIIIKDGNGSVIGRRKMDKYFNVAYGKCKIR